MWYAYPLCKLFASWHWVGHAICWGGTIVLVSRFIQEQFLVLSCSSICENMNVHEIWNGIKVQHIIIFVEIQRFYKIRGFATCNSLRQINSGFQWSNYNCISNHMGYIDNGFRCVVMFCCLHWHISVFLQTQPIGPHRQIYLQKIIWHPRKEKQMNQLSLKTTWYIYFFSSSWPRVVC